MANTRVTPSFSLLSDEELGRVCLGNWVQLNKVIGRLGRRECARLVFLELNGKSRPGLITRLHGRLVKLRRDQESAELKRDGGAARWLQDELDETYDRD